MLGAYVFWLPIPNTQDLIFRGAKYPELPVNKPEIFFCDS